MRQARQMMADGVEHGYVLCLTNRQLVPGPESTGTPTGVTINTRCSRGHPYALFHTHPGTGDIRPSNKDMNEAARNRIPWVCVGIPETGRIQCYRVPQVPL